MWIFLAMVAAWFRRFFARAEKAAREQERDRISASIREAEEREMVAYMERSAAMDEEIRRTRRESDRLATERRHGLLSASARVRAMPLPATRGIQISYPEDD